MASLVLGAAGAVIGSFFGMPQVGYMIGSAIGAAIDAPPGQDGPRMSDLKVQSSQYGQPIPIVFGRYRIAGQLIWSDALKEHAHEEGGSGGGGYTTYTYTCSFAVGLSEGTKRLGRIWMDGKLMYDPNGESFIKATSVAFYEGSENQQPDPTIEAVLGVGNVPGYRGMAYIVFADLELGKFGNRVPNIAVEVLDPEGVSFTTGDIVRSITSRTWLTPFEINVNALVDPVEGYAITSNMPARSAIEPLSQAFFFDAVESNGMMVYTRRGAAPMVVIPTDHIVLEDK